MEQYLKKKRQAKSFYQTFKTIRCSAIQSDITFNSSGFEHLTRQGKTARRKKDQIRRFKLLPCISDILKNPTKVEYREKIQSYEIKWHGQRIQKKNYARFWGLTKEINGKSVKVIIRQIGNGKKHFSVSSKNKNQLVEEPDFGMPVSTITSIGDYRLRRH